MNIKITHNWLLDLLDTDATPLEIQKYLSLCGPSVERIEEVNGETVYDIEITSNRIDTACVIGIAEEARAILKRFNKKAVVKDPPLADIPLVENPVSLLIEDTQGCTRRLIGLVLEVDGVKDAPEFMQKRLTAIGMRSLNTLVDITNYVMTEIGHPCHVFDYDRITTHKLVLRHAKKGEEIITLDEKKYNLDETDIIIDDGTGRVIDLPGIMGTANSVVTNSTKRILFFIESNDPTNIRRTSMRYGIRTMASTINEKSPDPEIAIIAFKRGVELYKKYAGAKVVSKLIDIYPNPPKKTVLSISKKYIDSKVGVSIPLESIISILTDLSFKVEKKGEDEFEVVVPSWRTSDVSIPEDIIEEVARVYGYHAIPSLLQAPAYVEQPRDTELLFTYQHVVKTYLKHRGYHEVMNYSAVSQELLKQFEIEKQNHLYITNSISEEIKYLRTSLIPSLVKNVKQNEGFAPKMKLFELAKTYIPTSSLPEEENKLCIATTISLDELKGILIGLMKELNIAVDFESKSVNQFLLKSVAGQIMYNSVTLGSFGQVKPALCRNGGVEKAVYVAELSFKDLMLLARVMPDYKSFSQYAHITNDLTIKKNVTFAEIKKIAFATSSKLISLFPVSTYKDTITLRLEFTDHTKNIIESEVRVEVEKIKAALTA